MTTLSYESVQDLLLKAMRHASSRLKPPSTTYRLQMHANFTLRDALGIVPYLHRLGISDLYVSSLLKARPGSLHGYDVIDHSQLNPELGTEEDLIALAEDLKRRDMGLILDVVPNHMCVGELNQWWMDVLENGSTSRFANHFDIAWRDHPRERLRGKVLLPILDEPYGRVIQAGRIKVLFEEGRFGVAVDQTRLPVDTRTYSTLLEPALRALRAAHGDENECVLELQSIVNAIRHLPPREGSDAEHISEALAEEAVIKRRLSELTHQSPDVHTQITHVVAEFSNAAANPETLASLIQLLDAQPYRPSFWRVALDEINYRRFFDVNDLAGLATERQEVFTAIHEKPFDWLRRGLIKGLRVDHIDGLLDPKEYLDRLQQQYVLACAHELWADDALHSQANDWPVVEAQLRSAFGEQKLTPSSNLYVVVEKILGLREVVPSEWPCHGTTGYEFLNEVNALFVDPNNEQALSDVYRHFTGESRSFEQIAYEGKRQVMRSTMASELSVLVHQLDNLAQCEWWSRDFTLNGLRQALEEMIACFPVYRTYVSAEASPGDQLMILRAAQRARRMNPLLGKEIFEFIVDTLLLRTPYTPTEPAAYTEQQCHFARKFQQLTSPVMAKGVEDTALYQFNRLVSLNEVGGDPARVCGQSNRLHAFLQNRAETYPSGLSPLSTHDTKRGEDVRARINVLSEIPDEWDRRIRTWSRMNRPYKAEVDEGFFAPDANEEYLIYQTLVGCWPRSSLIDEEFVNRLQAYMLKALREAKVHSSWILPETKYDTAVSTFLADILDSTKSVEFLSEMNDFQNLIRPRGNLNSLSQTLLRCLAPGVPDTYQGSESWNDSLVDPDNRRPVDFETLSRTLEWCDQMLIAAPKERCKWLQHELIGENVKQIASAIALRLRRDYSRLFQQPNYSPLEIVGTHQKSAFGFIVHDEQAAILVVVPRLLTQTPSDLTAMNLHVEAELIFPQEFSERNWMNAVTGQTVRGKDGRVSLIELFADLPFAICVLSSPVGE